MKTQTTIPTTYYNTPQERQTRELMLVIAELPRALEDWTQPEKIESFRSASLDKGDWWEIFDRARWSAVGDEKVAVSMLLAPVECVTEEQYQAFSKVILPAFKGLYRAFSGQKMPPLNLIKENFGLPRHGAAVGCYRRKSSHNEAFWIQNDSGGTITDESVTYGIMAECAVCKNLGVSELWHFLQSQLIRTSNAHVVIN